MVMCPRIAGRRGSRQAAGHRACEQQLDAKHPSKLMSVNNLAVLLQVQGKLAEAEPLYRRAPIGCSACSEPRGCNGPP